MGMPLVGFVLVILFVVVGGCGLSVLGSSVAATPSQRRLPWQYINAHSVRLVPPQQAPIRPSSIANSPSAMSSHSPSASIHKSRNSRDHLITPRAAYPIASPTTRQGPAVSPVQYPRSDWNHLAPAFSTIAPTGNFNEHLHPPKKSPAALNFKMKSPPPLQTLTLPPPPPNRDCTPISCPVPLTYTLSGSPCGCVWPLQVKLKLSIPIYTFFSLVTELAEEISASLSLNHSQVRIAGANSDNQQLEKSIVLINLVPRAEKFSSATVVSIYMKFWDRNVGIKDAIFGSYEVLYIHYPGLPPSPPSASSGINIVDNGTYPRNGDTMHKPLGVDLPRTRKHGRGVSVMIVLLCLTALIICTAVACIFVLKRQNLAPPHHQLSLATMPKQPGVSNRGIPRSSSTTYTSGALAYSGAAKTFTLIDIKKATNDFDNLRILGEGGFGVVYSGMLEDGRMVAVKVLKRDDHHGTREFLAEVEMLGRLHHRNLVKLIGICSEGHIRCLVYELIPNGSVESHLHGVDKERDPLGWDARMKIALGAARALAYLHEDSRPRVIHRDFKSSNILLEHDFTPKVSDFGLARAAIDEANLHISTQVMGTFGYLAPEYAMTGHLLVKSDVYSYGVVLLELLTGRKPVDLLQPQGQENLVSFARPLLTSINGLEEIVDQAIISTVSFETVAKVAAIASMCVQPEVSHRPFMGEVVQALKLVCNEFDETDMHASGNCSHEKLLIDLDDKNTRPLYDQTIGFSMPDHPLPLSSSGMLIEPETEERELGFLRRHSDSGPMRPRGRTHFWERLRSLSRGSKSEHGLSFKLWPETN